eukprot:Gregarina_sp_Poly_1__6059@NODE_319_length_9555_cov_130_182863_g273_i0_p1_GENE_NODE_319_length_9555_cov_130_182863_g273_i0NODE_319_length_9555_cov_130_182863_g273_i0_p1_ORF_typecomplete_len530_score44_27Glyco_transf_34/PF05637_12/3_9e03Glyco_transf_34/PF05637_12/0_00046Nucleotid_trans/PF03407_16/0_017_NODE_319_length_9555_cov_130_182863_g273_i014303019
MVVARGLWTGALWWLAGASASAEYNTQELIFERIPPTSKHCLQHEYILEPHAAGYNHTDALDSYGWEFLDSWFAAKGESNHNLSDHLVQVLYSPQSGETNETVTASKAFTKPLFCNVVIFTAHDNIDEQWIRFDQFRIEYGKHSPGTCVFNVVSGVSQEELNKKFEHDPDAGRNKWRFRLMERYRAGIILSELIFQGRIVTYNNQNPLLLYFDADAFPTNKHMTVEDVWDKFRIGIRHVTTETRICSSKDTEELFAAHCSRSIFEPSPNSVTQITFAVAMEMHCENEYAVNSGVWLARPSRALILILGSVILASENRVKHSFDDADQGWMNWALSELGELDYGFLQTLCSKYHLDYWLPSLDPNISEIPMTRLVKISKAKNHPILGKLAKAVFSKGLLQENEPQYIAWTSSRWFNAFGCPWFTTDPTRYPQGWHPGDFAVHFASCNHVGETGYWWRKLVYDYAQDLLPLPDTDWPWKQWLDAGRNFWHIQFREEKMIKLPGVTPPPFVEKPVEAVSPKYASFSTGPSTV